MNRRYHFGFWIADSGSKCARVHARSDPKSKIRNPKSFIRRSRNRHGVIYITVLAISTLLLVMAMGALMAARSLARSTTAFGQADEAAGYAFAAVEMGRLTIANDAYWRTDYSPGNWITNKNVGNGKMSLTVSTADSKFSNMTEDITFLGTGTDGAATQKLKAILNSTISPYTCMGYVLSVGGATTINSATINSNTAGLACNGSVTATGGSTTIGFPVTATGIVSGNYYQQQVLSGQSTAFAMPNVSAMSANSTYLLAGTTINYSSITGHSIQKVVLSPASNPYGATNTNGIYVINCGGNNLQIQNCRIVGTLVILNCGQLQIQNSVNWVPALTDYPCLLAQCTTLQLGLSNNALQETSGIGVSFNAPGTPYPYPSGTTNTTFTDSYPSTITGLMYVTGNAQLSGNNNIGILSIGGTCQISGTLTTTYDATYYSNPPPGFYSNTLTTDSNTYSRSVN